MKSLNARALVLSTAFFSLQLSPLAAENSKPHVPGKLVDLGGHRLHVLCTGHGSPTVVVENGLGDFSFDWVLVQDRVSHNTRICTYDRAGYAWSDPGPKPRTFDQINLELRNALTNLGEQGPFVLVGHSYGGPVMRNFALDYPGDTAGIVFVDAAFEGMRVGVGGKNTIRLGEGAQPREIPRPREAMSPSDKPAPLPPGMVPPNEPLDPLYKVLSPEDQRLQMWAQYLPKLEDAEQSQREWSDVYYAKQLATPQAGTLGSIPVLVLTRENGGYTEDLDVPAAQMEQERKAGQALLATLSNNSKQVLLTCGHNMELEAPADVADAILRMVTAVRHGAAL